MLVYGVEGDRNAASLVKDSKSYIEIAKFVEAYTTIIQNPNEFLSEVGEEPINTETDLLSWEQLVKIMTQCDLGFDPVPNEKQLVSYYSYAKQIRSISKETKELATVGDVAEAQKHYYNFIDEETEKANAIYIKQHEIAQNRAREVEIIDTNLKNMQTKNYLYFAGMMVSVFFVAFGLASFFFNNPIARIFGFSNQYVGAFVMMALGFAGFFVFDRFYIKSKQSYFGYKKSTRSTVSRSERTSRDEKVLRDKLAKYEEDLKIAKYELADKEKRFDVEKNIERLRERNKYYRLLRDRDGLGREGFGRERAALLDELDQALFGKGSLFSFLGDDEHRARRRHRPAQSLEQSEHLFRVGEGLIDDNPRAHRGGLSAGYNKHREISSLGSKASAFNERFIKPGKDFMEQLTRKTIDKFSTPFEFKNFKESRRRKFDLPQNIAQQIETAQVQRTVEEQRLQTRLDDAINKFKSSETRFISEQPAKKLFENLEESNLSSPLALADETKKKTIDIFSEKLDTSSYNDSDFFKLVADGETKTQEQAQSETKAREETQRVESESNKQAAQQIKKEEELKKDIKNLQEFGGREL